MGARNLKTIVLCEKVTNPFTPLAGFGHTIWWFFCYMNNGWIKLHRKTMDSTVWKNPETVMVWVWCLMKATHEEFKFSFNGDDITIKSGQFITGRYKALEELPGISEQKWRTCIKYLVNTQRLTSESTNQFTLISVKNWSKYQDANQQTNQRLTNEQPTTNHIQEHKEHKEYMSHVKKIKNGEIFTLKCGIRVKKNYGVFFAAETNNPINEKDFPELKLYS